MTARVDEFVDLSDNNANPNLDAYAAAGHQAIALKATEGTGYTWTGGAALHAGAHSRNLAVGRYGWPRPEFGGTAQAEHFVRAVEGNVDPAKGDWLFGDVEASYNYSTGREIPDPPGWAATIEQFMARIHELLPEVPLGAYTGNWYCSGKPALTAVLRQYPIILSDYVNSVPANPLGFHLAAQQFTSRAVVPGCGAAGVDYNRWINRAALAATDEMEQIMTWYPSKAAFQADVRAQAAAGVLDVLEHHAATAHAAIFGGFNTDPRNPHQGPVSAWTIARTVRDEQHTPAHLAAPAEAIDPADPDKEHRPTPWPDRATAHDVQQ